MGLLNLKEEKYDGFGLNSKLSELFGIPPFSIMDTKRGYWQDRKREWTALGIQSELGRLDDALFKSDNISDMHTYYKKKDPMYGKKRVGKCMPEMGAAYGRKEKTGTSIFDPVLCELAYTWFLPNNGSVLDPFAGGSVRGIVASKLGRKYTGVELSTAQVEANRKQYKDMLEEGVFDEKFTEPIWINDDSRNIDQVLEGEEYDFIFSCPPYAMLEVYSDDPRDLSNKEYPEFLTMYEEIIKKACDKLKDNRFACFVVSEVRSKTGSGEYLGFVPDTIKAFEKAGLKYYNEMILANVAGTLPVRAKKPFASNRKIGRCHQNVLVFLKGDAKKATNYCGEVKVYFPKEDDK